MMAACEKSIYYYYNEFFNNDDYMLKPVCSFMINFHEIYIRKEYGITSKGLIWNDEEIINNGGYHGTVEKAGRAALKKGYHKIHVLYFDAGGENSLKVFIQPEFEYYEFYIRTIYFHHLIYFIHIRN